MLRATRIASLFAALPLSAGLALAQGSPQAAKYGALVDKYCVSCHDEIDYKGGLDLGEVDFSKVGDNAKILEHVVTKIRGSSMPPVGKARPDPATYQAFAAWLETELDRNAVGHPNAGRPAPYRLNRTEYKNAIRDLLGLDIDVRALMAPDSSSYGFDNIADVLNLSPALLEGYLASADKISALAVGDPALPMEDALYRVSQRFSQNEHVEGLPLGTRGGLEVDHYFPLDGTYEIDTTFLKNTLGVIRGLEFAHQFELSVDGKQALSLIHI